MSLLSPSGGLVYHLRALRHREGLWAPFREAVAGWLAARLSTAPELILVGPSAGHCLPLGQLAKFPKILVLEPDPLARWLLRQRLTGHRVEVEARDLMVAPLLEGRRGLEAVLERWPRAAVLFCNLLGQLHLSLSDAEHDRFQEGFRERLWPALAGRPWASFHDRFSLDRAPGQVAPGSFHFESLPSPEQLAEACFGAEASVTLLDHGTAELFPKQLPRDYFSWQITPQALHLVEAVAAPGGR